VEIDDIKALSIAVLRHRLVLNYNAESQGQTAETVIKKLIDTIPAHDGGAVGSRVERVLK
jgi:MoxR-like ATPase